MKKALIALSVPVNSSIRLKAPCIKREAGLPALGQDLKLYKLVVVSCFLFFLRFSGAEGELTLLPGSWRVNAMDLGEALS